MCPALCSLGLGGLGEGRTLSQPALSREELENQSGELGMAFSSVETAAQGEGEVCSKTVAGMEPHLPSCQGLFLLFFSCSPLLYSS